MAKRAWAPEGKEIIPIVRLINVDLDGNRPIYLELRKVKGVSWMFAHAVLNALRIDKWIKTGALSEEELRKIEDAIRNPSKYGIPSWLYNRQKDPETGKDMHLVASDLEIAMKFDIKKEIEINSWRGFRHKEGLPVRGQRIKSHHRRFKRTVGVQRKKK